MIQKTIYKICGLIVSSIVLIVLFAASNVYGYTSTTWASVMDAYLYYNGSDEHIIIREMRLPRAIVGVLTGAALAISGTLMQAVTKNPIASPGVLGINAGASFFIVAGISVFSLSSKSHLIWFAFAGAGVAAILVYIIGSMGSGMYAIRLTLAGAAVAALFSSFTTALLVSNERALERILFWLSGSVEGSKLEYLIPVLPFYAVGFAISFLLGKKLNVLSLSDEVARGLGLHLMVTKGVSLFVVIMLAGSSVALCGPIGFIGLMTPHIVKRIIGVDYRWVIPYSAVFGGILLTAADIGARFAAYPREVPAGVMVAIIGAPFFIYLARKEMMRA